MVMIINAVNPIINFLNLTNLTIRKDSPNVTSIEKQKAKRVINFVKGNLKASPKRGKAPLIKLLISAETGVLLARKIKATISAKI